jgi:hypothetical protein
MQLEMSKVFFELKGRKFFGAEMFESGNQLVVNEYVKGLYTDDDSRNNAAVEQLSNRL